MNQDGGRYIPPPPPPPPTLLSPQAGVGVPGLPPPPPRSPGSSNEHSIQVQVPRRGPVSPSSVLNTALSGFTPVHAPQSPFSTRSFRSPIATATSNSLTPLSPHGQVTTNASRSPLNPGANEASTPSSSPSFRNASGGTGAMMEYNPQQWGRGGPIGGAYRPHTTLTVSAAPRMLDDSGQPLESPPPPYTPNSAPNLSQQLNARPSPLHLQTNNNVRATSHLVTEASTPVSAITAAATPMSAIGRSDNAMNFPPPPPNSQRDRSGSRSRFGLSALTRGRSTDRSNTPPTNAIENLQYGTREALANAPVQRWDQSRPPGARQTMYMPQAAHEPVPLPPGARRSASAGTATHHHWAPVGNGQGLPPPPGPPPPTTPSSRSASMSRAGTSYDTAISVPSADFTNAPVPIISPPTRRAPPHRGTQLGPVPPTPADYHEFPQSPLPPQLRGRSPAHELDTAPPVPAIPANFTLAPATQSSNTSGAQHASHLSESSSSNWSGSLRREPSTKGIRERRSESRAGKDRVRDDIGEGSSSHVQPADLVLSPVSSKGGIGRAGAVKKTRASPIEPSIRSSPNPIRVAATPPPSAGHNFLSPQKSGANFTNAPVQIGDQLESARSTPHSTQTAGDSFAIASIKRHQEFVQKESKCTTDMERLRLFADYMVAESRIRRDQYAAAFATMEAPDVLDLTRNLWRAQQPTPTSAPRPASTEPSSASSLPRPTRSDSMGSYMSLNSPMSGSQANFTPLTEPESPASIASSAGGDPRERGPWARHKPVLSPIPSMAMSTVPDEDCSRGRPASRWWESSAGSTGASQRIERTKRESKFMGVSRETLATLQWQDEPSPSMHGGTPRTVGEYPIEKTGWHDDGGQGSSVTPRRTPASVPATPDPHKLDVSRLVTLPPPYPRHHPAMANNHPDLASVRSTLENLRDVDEIKTTKETFNARWRERRERKAREAADRRTQMRRNIQEQLSLGQMTYGQAARAEEDFNTSEAQLAQTCARQEYDAYQPEIKTRLHAMLSEKITRGNACITQLCAGLKTSADSPTPNEPQEEGDEQPELLEKLNLLKWLTEARENLHRALDDLEGESNELYREVIVQPLRVQGNEAKLAEVQQFFDQDMQERKMNYEKAINKRYEQYAHIVERNVARGVEDHLSAFWDIAPGLSSVIAKVPEDLVGNYAFELHVPPAEYEENPQYGRHPLQYLYTLLTHAEKSAYQFIESQVNLMCLLHEAQSGLMGAGLKLMESQRVAEGEEWVRVREEMGHVKEAEEARLTGELKERVATVESQWREGLGSSLEGVKERVRGFLLESGGWDDSLLE